MKTRNCTFITAALLLLLLNSLYAAKDPKSEKTEGGLPLNKKIGSLIKGESKYFQDKRLGMCLTYNAPGITLTIYEYNMGYKKIPSDISSDMLKKHFELVQSEIYNMQKGGKYKSVKKLKADTVDIGENKKAFMAKFEYIQSGNKRKSYLYLWASNNNFIKIRYTYDLEEEKEAEKNLQILLKTLSE